MKSTTTTESTKALLDNTISVKDVKEPFDAIFLPGDYNVHRITLGSFCVNEVDHRKFPVSLTLTDATPAGRWSWSSF